MMNNESKRSEKTNDAVQTNSLTQKVRLVQLSVSRTSAWPELIDLIKKSSYVWKF